MVIPLLTIFNSSEVSIHIDGFTAYIYDREFFMILLNDKKDIYR